MKIKHLMTTTAALAMLLIGPQPADAQFSFSFGFKKKEYSLHFSPASLTLEQGQTGHFKIDYRKKGHYRFSRAKDYRVSVSPGFATRLQRRGNGFDFVAQRPGLYRIDARHDSGRAWKGATGSMFIRVLAPKPAPRPRPRPRPVIVHPGHSGHGGHAGNGGFGYGYSPQPQPSCQLVPVLSRLELIDSATGKSFAHGLQTLAPNRAIRLQIVGFDQLGRRMAVRPSWVLSSPRSGRRLIVAPCRTAATLLTGSHACPKSVYSVTVAQGRVATRMTFRVFRNVAPRVARIDLQIKHRHYGQFGAAPSRIWVRRGSLIDLRAIGVTSRGQALGFSDSWSISSPRKGHLHRSGNQQMKLHIDDHASGSLTLTVRDPKTGVTRSLLVRIY